MWNNNTDIGRLIAETISLSGQAIAGPAFASMCAASVRGRCQVHGLYLCKDEGKCSLKLTPIQGSVEICL